MFCLTGSCTSVVGETIPLCLKGQILPFRCLCSPPINFGMSWAHASKSKIWLIISACFGILWVPYKCKIPWFSAKEQRKCKPPGDAVRENHIELLFKTKKRRKIKKNNWDSFQSWLQLQTKDESAHLLLTWSLLWLQWVTGHRIRPQFRRHYWKCLTSYISWFLIKLTALPEVFHLPGEGSARQPRAAGNSKCRTVPPCLEALRGQTALGCSSLSTFTAPLTNLGHPAVSPGVQAVCGGAEAEAAGFGTLVIVFWFHRPALCQWKELTMHAFYNFFFYLLPFYTFLACYNCHKITLLYFPICYIFASLQGDIAWCT